MRLRRTRHQPELEKATADAAKSMQRAVADHERERQAAGRDAGLIASLRKIRAENHFSDIITAAFRGET